MLPRQLESLIWHYVGLSFVEQIQLVQLLEAQKQESQKSQQNQEDNADKHKTDQFDQAGRADAKHSPSSLEPFFSTPDLLMDITDNVIKEAQERLKSYHLLFDQWAVFSEGALNNYIKRENVLINYGQFREGHSLQNGFRVNSFRGEEYVWEDTLSFLCRKLNDKSDLIEHHIVRLVNMAYDFYSTDDYQMLGYVCLHNYLPQLIDRLKKSAKTQAHTDTLQGKEPLQTGLETQSDSKADHKAHANSLSVVEVATNHKLPIDQRILIQLCVSFIYHMTHKEIEKFLTHNHNDNRNLIDYNMLAVNYNINREPLFNDIVFILENPNLLPEVIEAFFNSGMAKIIFKNAEQRHWEEIVSALRKTNNIDLFNRILDILEKENLNTSMARLFGALASKQLFVWMTHWMNRGSVPFNMVIKTQIDPSLRHGRIIYRKSTVLKYAADHFIASSTAELKSECNDLFFTVLNRIKEYRLGNVESLEVKPEKVIYDSLAGIIKESPEKLLHHARHPAILNFKARVKVDDRNTWEVLAFPAIAVEAGNVALAVDLICEGLPLNGINYHKFFKALVDLYFKEVPNADAKDENTSVNNNCIEKLLRYISQNMIGFSEDHPIFSLLHHLPLSIRQQGPNYYKEAPDYLLEYLKIWIAYLPEMLLSRGTDHKLPYQVSHNSPAYSLFLVRQMLEHKKSITSEEGRNTIEILLSNYRRELLPEEVEMIKLIMQISNIKLLDQTGAQFIAKVLAEKRTNINVHDVEAIKSLIQLKAVLPDELKINEMINKKKLLINGIFNVGFACALFSPKQPLYPELLNVIKLHPRGKAWINAQMNHVADVSMAASRAEFETILSLITSGIKLDYPIPQGADFQCRLLVAASDQLNKERKEFGMIFERSKTINPDQSLLHAKIQSMLNDNEKKFTESEKKVIAKLSKDIDNIFEKARKEYLERRKNESHQADAKSNQDINNKPHTSKEDIQNVRELVHNSILELLTDAAHVKSNPSFWDKVFGDKFELPAHAGLRRLLYLQQYLFQNSSVLRDQEEMTTCLMMLHPKVGRNSFFQQAPAAIQDPNVFRMVFDFAYGGNRSI